MDGEVAAAYRERIRTQINASQPRTTLAGKHDITGHGRPHSASKFDAARTGGKSGDGKRTRRGEAGGEGGRDADARRAITHQRDGPQFRAGASRQSRIEINAASRTAAGQRDVTRRRGDEAGSRGQDALRTGGFSDEGDITRGAGQHAGERDALREGGHAHAEADGVIEINQARERDTGGRADGCSLGEDAQAGLITADGDGRNRPVERDGGRVGPGARVEDQVR